MKFDLLLSLGISAFGGIAGLAAAGLVTDLAMERISVREGIPFSQVISPYPDWLPLASLVFFAVFGFLFSFFVLRRNRSNNVVQK